MTSHNKKPISIRKLDEVNYGDLLFFKTLGSAASKLISFTQRFFGDKAYSDITHVGICIGKTSKGTPIIAHLSIAGFFIEPISEIFLQEHAQQGFYILRLANVPLANKYRESFVNLIKNFQQQNVAYDKLGLLHTVFPLQGHNDHQHGLKKSFCSSIIAEVLTHSKFPGFEDYYSDVMPKKLYYDCKNTGMFLELDYNQAFQSEDTRKYRFSPT